MEEKKKEFFEFVLDGDELKRFLQIKKDFGLTDDAELARFLINRYFKTIKEK